MNNSFAFMLDEPGLHNLAVCLAESLEAGTVIALWGDLGVGKTTFCRFLIQALTGEAIAVPSPTFTLVQVYDARQGEIWHCDLYRLNAPEEAFELGLQDAFHQAICLLEWPERLGALLPQVRLDINFKIITETMREITFTLPEPKAKTTGAASHYTAIAPVLHNLSKK